MIIATNNKGKLREIKEIFEDYEIYSLKEKGIKIDVEEDGKTFYENALKKATQVYSIANEPVLADDSGLCIEELKGFPGVLTHRFPREDASDEERNNALIEMTNKCSDRRAKVVCIIVYYDGENIIVGEGVINGIISHERRGTNGFEFDEIFELNDGRTLAELSSIEKNAISARFLALNDLKEKLNRTVFTKKR